MLKSIIGLAFFYIILILSPFPSVFSGTYPGALINVKKEDQATVRPIQTTTNFQYIRPTPLGPPVDQSLQQQVQQMTGVVTPANPIQQTLPTLLARTTQSSEVSTVCFSH